MLPFINSQYLIITGENLIECTLKHQLCLREKNQSDLSQKALVI